MKIAVIGAGLSGLTAALRFQQAGHDVVVYESNNYPGGRCKAFRQDGYLIDTCPELVATSYRRWLSMVDEMGLKGDLVNSPSVVSMLRNGKLIDIDMGKLASAAFTPALSWRAKLNLVLGAIRLRHQIRAVPHYLLDNIQLDDPKSNAEALSLKMFGREVTENLIEPLLRPIGGVTLDSMSTLLLPYTLSDWTQMVSLKGGLQALPIAMAKRLNVRYECGVERVASHASHVAIDYTTSSGQRLSEHYDKCLITVPYDQAEAIYPRFAQISQYYSNSMTYMRMLDIKLTYSKRPHSKAAMVMIPFKENPRINVISLSHNKSPDRAPEGKALFSIFTEHKDFENMAAKSDEQIVAEIRSELESLYPEIKGHFLFSYVARQHRVSYIPDAGFFHRTRQLWDAVGREPRVQLGGDVFMFGGLEAAVASGERAAERLLAQPVSAEEHHRAAAID